MNVFCPNCSAEHSVDGDQIPMTGMTLHCPQCDRGFRVTPEGEVEAEADADVASGTSSDAEVDEALDAFEADLAATSGGADGGEAEPATEASVAEMTFPDVEVESIGGDELVEEEGGIDQVTTGPPPPPRSAPQGVPFVATGEPPGSIKDGEYHKTEALLVQPRDIPWDGTGEPPEGVAPPGGPAGKRTPTRPMSEPAEPAARPPVSPEGDDPFADWLGPREEAAEAPVPPAEGDVEGETHAELGPSPVDQEPLGDGMDLDEPFEITGLSSLDDVREAPGGPSSQAPPPPRPETSGGTVDPDGLFDLDLDLGGEIGGESAPPPPRPQPAGPQGSGPPSGRSSQPLLEEMDFSSLLQEEPAPSPDGLFGRRDEPQGGTAEPTSALSEDELAQISAGADEAPDHDPEGVFELDITHSGASGQRDLSALLGPGPGPAGATAAPDLASDFAPGQVPSVRKRRRSRRGRTAKYALLGILLVAAAGLALGQTDLGYFGMNVLFPKKEEPKKPAIPAHITAVSAVPKDDTAASFISQIERLEKALQVNANDEASKLALATVLSTFSARYPDEYSRNMKYQRRLEVLVKELKLEGRADFAVRKAIAAQDYATAARELERFAAEKPGSAELAELRGQLAFAQGNYEVALGHFQTVLKADPGDNTAQFLIAECQRHLGALDEARASYDAVLKRAPKHGPARLAMAHILVEKGDWDAALEVASAVLADARAQRLTAQEFRAHRLLGQIYAQTGNPDEQLKSLQNALAIHRDDETSIVELAGYYRERGKFDEALELVASCDPEKCSSEDYFSIFATLQLDRKEPNRALPILAKGLTAHPKSMPLLILQGKARQAAGEALSAKDSFEKARELDPGAPKPYVLLADASVAMKRPEEAVAILREGLTKVRQREPLLERMADLFDAAGESDQLQKVLEELITANPLNHDARLRLAVSLKKTGLLDDSFKHFEILKRHGKMTFEARIEYADALRTAKAYDQAEAELRQLERLDKTDMRVKVLLGAVVAEKGRHDEAFALLSSVVEKDPRNGLAFYYLGRIEYARGNKDRALDMLAQAVRGKDPRPEFKAAYAKLLIEMGGTERINKGVSEYTGIVTLHELKGRVAVSLDQLTDVYLERGKAYMKLLRYNEALEDFERAMELNPLRADAVTLVAAGLLSKRRYKDAERYLATVLDENPNYAPAHYYLGVIEYEKGNRLRAKQHLLKSILEDDAQFPEAHRYIGHIFREQRLDREARRYFRRYLELAPESAPDRADIERLIKL